QINAQLDMPNLYKYLDLIPRKATPASVQERSAAVPTLDPAQPQKPASDVRLSTGDRRYNRFIGLVTAIQRLQLTDRQTEGIYLPGYTPDIGFLGTLKPTPGFTFGSQRDVREEAARRGWLTLYQEFNQQYTAVKNQQLDIQASLTLIPDLTIDLNATRVFSETYSENYRVIPNSLDYQSLNPYSFGNFTISTILVKTAFSNNNAAFSQTFENFRDNRLEVARRLAIENGFDPNNTDAEGYPVGYGRSSQAVLIPAFIAAYTGKDASGVKMGAFRDVPLPNWDIKYTGLMRPDYFRRNFRRFSLNHGYRSGYTINQYQSNLDYDPQNPYEFNQANNFKNRLLFSNINLTELFSPLIRIDLETNNAIRILAEIKKDRALSLSFDNNLLTEIKGNEYVLGLGYRIPDLRISTNIAGNRRIIASDLNFKADVAYRKNINIIRYLDLE